MIKNKDYYAKLIIISTIVVSALFYLFGIIEVFIEGNLISNSYYYNLISSFLAPSGYGLPTILALIIIVVSINLLNNKFDDKKARIALRISTILYVAFIIFGYYLSINKIVIGCFYINEISLQVLNLLWGIFSLIILVLSFVLLFKNGFDTVSSFVLFDKDVIATKPTEVTTTKEEKPIESKTEDKKPDEVKKN